jgi:hypothetical protein
MIPPVIAIPVTPASISQPAAPKVAKIATTHKAAPTAAWKQSKPVVSPNLQTTPKLRSIAQSELPGSSTPSAPPPPPNSNIDTGSGYPTRIPRNYFGPAIGFGNGNSAFGVISRFPFAEKYSIRPSVVFGTTTTVRVPITYDFELGDREPFERNPLVTFHVGGGAQFASGGGTVGGDKFSLLGTIGVDVNLFEGIALVGSFNTDFASNNGTNIGLGFEF